MYGTWDEGADAGLGLMPEGCFPCREFCWRVTRQLGTGVKDFFFEPAEGLMKSPTAFGKGVAKGTMSLVGNTTSGVLGFTTKIT